MACKPPVVLTLFASLAGCAGTSSTDLAVTSDRQAFAVCIGVSEHALQNQTAPTPTADGIVWEPQPEWLVLAGLEDIFAAAVDTAPSAEAARMMTLRNAARLTGTIPPSARDFPTGLNSCQNFPVPAFSDSGDAI